MDTVEPSMGVASSMEGWCSQHPIAYNDKQFAELELHKENLGLTNKQM